MPNGRTNNFPRKWAWPRSSDPYNFWHGFVWAMPSRRTNKFPWKWTWLRSCDH